MSNLLKKRRSITLGHHYLIDLYECGKIANAKSELEKVMLDAAKIMKVTVVKSVFHNFNPHGLSGVVVIAESHIAVHTWPEFNKVAIDVFSCKKVSAKVVIKFFKKSFEAKKITFNNILRGAAY